MNLLLVHGALGAARDRDALVSVEETLTAARQPPKGEIVVLPATAHPIEQVRLPLIAAMVADFVAGMSAT